MQSNRDKKSNLQILGYEETSLGPLCLRRRELLTKPGIFVTEVTLNHEFLMSSYNTDSERAIANRSVDLHGGELLSVLVGGLGLGYTAWELLENPKVSEVEVVEYLPQVVDWLRAGLVPLSAQLNASENMQIVEGDVYNRLLNSANRQYDLIVIDVDHSPSDQLGEADHNFYTVAGLKKAKAHLRPGGVLAVWSYAESSDFSDALRSVFSNVLAEPVTTVNDLVGIEQTDWLFFGSV
jgi:spermidine synthase